MIRLFTILIAALGLLVHMANSYACDENSSRLVARTFMLANPVLGRENEIIPLVQSNRVYFAAGGAAIQCMQRLGMALTNAGLSQFQQNQGNSPAEQFAGSMPEGLEHLPGEVSDSLNRYSSDILTMGQELNWLAEVLPSVVLGNYSPYNSTGTETRRRLRQILPMYQQMCRYDPSICQMMTNLFGQLSPQIEQQIFALALQLGN
jgi:hypothetical protein